MALLGLTTVMLLTRHLGPTGFGYYRTTLSYLSFVAMLTDLGLYLITLRDISREDADPSRVVGNALAMRLAIVGVALLFAVVTTLVLPYAAVVQHGILLGTLSCTAMSGNHVLLAVCQRTLRQWQAALTEIVGTVLMLALVWLLIRMDGGVVAAVGAMSVGNVTTFAGSWLLARKLVPFRLRCEWDEWQRIAVMTLPVAGVLLVSLFHRRADIILLSLLQPAADVGLYGIVCKLFETLVALPDLFAGLMMPFLSQYALRDRAQFHRYLSMAFDLMAVGTIGVVVVVLAFAEEMVTFVGGAAFLPAATAMQILSLAVTLAAFSTLFKFAVTALDAQKVLLWGQGAGAVIGLIAYLFLIPPYSYIGAAWGMALAEGTICTCFGVAVAKAAGGIPSLMRLGKALIAGGVTLGVFHLLKRTEMFWGVNMLLGGSAYLGLLLAFRAMPKQLTSNFAPEAFVGDLRTRYSGPIT